VLSFHDIVTEKKTYRPPAIGANAQMM